MPFGDFLAPAPIAYATAYLGLQNPRRWAIIRGADYSYGVFLYGAAIQQVVAALGAWAHGWVFNTILSLIMTSAFAALSWHLVEKRAMELRHPLMRVEAWWLQRRSRGGEAEGVRLRARM